MKLIAHRGASYIAPENTLAAIRLAWEEQADGIEIDVHLTRDGRVAVIHDANTRRTTGFNGKVDALAFRELKALDAGSWKGVGWKDERIPELKEVFAATPAGKAVLVEIKCGPGILPELHRTLAASGPGPGRVLLVGFDLDVMRMVKRELPDYKVIWNVELKKRLGRWSPSARAMIKQALARGIDGLGLGMCGAVDSPLVSEVFKAGLKLFVWTVDDAETARKMNDLGVQYLATNRPGDLWKQSVCS